MTAVADPITVTKEAANKITQLLDEEKKKEAGLRVFVQGGSLRIPVRPDDRGRCWGRRGVVARMLTGPYAHNPQARHLPILYDFGRPSSVIRFRTLQARTASRPCPDGVCARRPGPMIDLYRKNAFSTRACRW